MTSHAPGGRVTRKRAQMQKDKDQLEETKNADDAEPKIQEGEETKGVKEENLRIDVQPPSAPNDTKIAAAAVEPAAPSGVPPAIKVEPPSGANAGPRPVLPAPGAPLLRPPFNPALAGGGPPRPGAAPGTTMPVGLPPGLAPALRGANPAQIAEMIAAARQIQQQRLLQMQQQQAAAGGGAPAAAAAAAGGPSTAPRPTAPAPVPLSNIPAPIGQPSRPFLLTARPAVPNEAGTSTAPPAAAAGGVVIPPPTQPHGSLKRKSDDRTPAIATGVAMGFPGPQAVPGTLGQPLPAGAPAPAAPGLSEEVATSAGEQQQQQPAPGTGPAASVSAHFTYGNSGELYGDEDGSGGSGAGLDADGKKVRLVWTQELHNRFINALSHLGLKHAVPKNILTMMNVEGMTRENVASHLQKYRLYLKKIGGHSEKDRVDADVLQALHEQNVQHMAAQQAMQQSMAAVTGAVGGHHHHAHLNLGGGGFMGSLHHASQHQYTTAGGGGGLDGTLPDASAAAAMGAHPGVGAGGGLHHSGSGGSGSGGHPNSNNNSGPPAIYIAPGDIVEGIPVSDIPVAEPVSPTVTAAVEAGGKFNPQGWQYPPLPLPDHQHHHSHHPASIPASGAVMGMPHQVGTDPHHHQLPPQQQQYSHFNYHQQHHSNLGDLAAAAAGAGEAHQGHGPAPAVWTDNGEGWADGWPHQTYPEDGDHHGNRLLKSGGGKDGANGEGGATGEGEDGQKGTPNTGDGGSGSGGGGGDGSGGNNNNVVGVDDDDDDDDDPPLIPAVPSAGDIHHLVERVPMRMADHA